MKLSGYHGINEMADAIKELRATCAVAAVLGKNEVVAGNRELTRADIIEARLMATGLGLQSMLSALYAEYTKAILLLQTLRKEGGVLDAEGDWCDACPSCKSVPGQCLEACEMRAVLASEYAVKVLESAAAKPSLVVAP